MEVSYTSTCLKYLKDLIFYHYTNHTASAFTFHICFQISIFFLLPLVHGSPFAQQLQFLTLRSTLYEAGTYGQGKISSASFYMSPSEFKGRPLHFSTGKYLGQSPSSISCPYFQGFSIDSFMFNT